MENSFSKKLRTLCSSYRSVSEVCRMLGFDRQQFDKYLSGKVRPSHHNLQRIAQGLGVDVDALIDPEVSIPAPEEATKVVKTDRIKYMMDRAFPGDINRLRAMLGFYHMHFQSPRDHRTVIRSLVQLFERDGKICSKTIEISSAPDGVQEVLKFEGLASFLGNCIFLLEFETTVADTIVETVLYPSHRKRVDILTGLTFGMTSQLYRQPFAAAVAWKYLGRTVEVRDQIAACGSYSIDDLRIDPRIRKYLQEAGSSAILSLGPS